MNFKEFLGQIIFPRSCAACKVPLDKGIICKSCLVKIPVNQTFFCATCDARLPDGKMTCHRNASCLIGGGAQFSNPIVKELVHRLKFRGIREAAVPLAELTAKYLLDPFVTCHLSRVAIIVPVPLSKHRLNERGFNQAEEIAKQVCGTMAMTMRTDLLTRTRNTKPQTETKSIEERTRNLQDCFAATSAVAGKNILLIDDVTTSGATFREAARVLKMAGARKIIAVAAAKA
jgi:ComF family protein